MDAIALSKHASGLPAYVCARLRDDLAALNEKRHQQAQRALEAAASQLKRAGWTTEVEIRKGPALTGLLTAARVHGADVLVLGAHDERSRSLVPRQRGGGRPEPVGQARSARALNRSYFISGS